MLEAQAASWPIVNGSSRLPVRAVASARPFKATVRGSPDRPRDVLPGRQADQADHREARAADVQGDASSRRRVLACTGSPRVSSTRPHPAPRRGPCDSATSAAPARSCGRGSRADRRRKEAIREHDGALRRHVLYLDSHDGSPTPPPRSADPARRPGCRRGGRAAAAAQEGERGAARQRAPVQRDDAHPLGAHEPARRDPFQADDEQQGGRQAALEHGGRRPRGLRRAGVAARRQRSSRGC